MDSSPGEMEKSAEELTGRKKSRFKQLKTRLFGKLKKKDSEGLMKQSQSASDITDPEGRRRDAYDSEDEFTYPQCLSSRALSHDSIFITDQTPAPEPTRLLSQDNVHSKIKDLQLKLQQQNLHLGPPPMLIPGKRFEDSGATSEDDGLPCSPPEMYFSERVMHGAVYKYAESQKHLSSLSLAGTGSEEEEQGDPFQPSSRPLSPVSKPSPKPISSSTSALATPPSTVDFGSPACFMPRLDNSAARHRMSVKPRNQRASTRGNRMVSLSPRHLSESISDLENVLSEEDDDETVTSTKTVRHLLATSSPNVELKEQRCQKTTESVQDQEENLNKTESHLPSLSVEFLQSGESLDPEVKVTTNPLYLQPMSFSSSSGPPSPSGLSESTLRAHSPIQKHDTNNIQIQTTDNLIAKESNQDESSFRQYPLSLPRTTKPKTDIKNPLSSKGAAESELCNFLITSARNRSKTTYEKNQNEGHLKRSPMIHKSYPELQKDEEREMKPEIQSLLQQIQDSKCVCKEATPPVMSKPTMGANVKKTDTFADHVESEKLEDAEDRRNAFGVQLRSTSLSLRYRSEVSNIKDETKRYSLESNTAPVVSEEHAGKAETIRNVDSNSKSKPSVPKKQDSQSLEIQDNGRPSIQNTTGVSKEAACEPGWMSLAREKTRARLATNQSPVQPSQSPSQPLKAASQPKTQTLHPLKTLNTPSPTSSQRPATKPTSAGAKDKQDKGKKSAAEDDTTKRASTNSKTDVNTRAVPPNITEAVTVTSELPGSSSSSSPSAADIPQQHPPRSDGVQPSWMELAKRKSLAWSDKTLE